MVVHNNGAFFGGQRTVSDGNIKGGTTTAVVFLPLPELGHGLEAQGLLPGIGQGHTANGPGNEGNIEVHCKKTLEQCK